MWYYLVLLRMNARIHKYGPGRGVQGIFMFSTGRGSRPISTCIHVRINHVSLRHLSRCMAYGSAHPTVDFVLIPKTEFIHFIH